MNGTGSLMMNLSVPIQAVVRLWQASAKKIIVRFLRKERLFLMSKFKVGDKFIVEIGECYDRCLPFGDDNTPNELYRIKGFNSLVFDDNGLDKLQKYEEEVIAAKFYEKGREEAQIPYSEAYNQGLQDAWELAKGVVLKVSRGGFDEKKIIDIFGSIDYAEIFNSNPQEALAKIEDYEQEIKVGDVVMYFNTDTEFLVIDKDDTSSSYDFWVINLETFKLDRIMNKPEYFKKTGKHIDIQQIFDGIGKE